MEAAGGARSPALPPPEAAWGKRPLLRALKLSTAAPLKRKWRDFTLPAFSEAKNGAKKGKRRGNRKEELPELERHRGSTHQDSRGFIPLRDWFPWQGLLW